MNLKWLIFSPLLGSIAAAADVTSVEVRPQIPFLETTVAGLSANFDIVLNNHERASVQVSEVSVTYVDDHGRSLYERRIDENGSVPSIDTIGNSMVARGKSKMMFNPFPSIPPDITPVGTTVRVVLTVNPTASHPGVRTLIASSRLRAAPPESQGMLLPLVGQVLVWDGHDALSHHRRWDYELPMLRSLGYTTNGMRYSYDLVRVDDRGNRFYGGQARNENHLSWNLPVRSPADGTVVDMESQQPDDGSSDVQAFKARPNLMFGNFIVLKHSEGVYSLLGHLHQSRGNPTGWYAEAGIGAHLLSETQINDHRRFSTAFQFGDHVGVGLRFGQRGEYDLGYRFQHLSNADIKKANDGINFS